jgi:hypothetical protein
VNALVEFRVLVFLQTLAHQLMHAPRPGGLVFADERKAAQPIERGQRESGLNMAVVRGLPRGGRMAVGAGPVDNGGGVTLITGEVRFRMACV